MKPNLLVLTDFSPAAERARAYAAALAAALDAELHLVHVFAPLPIPTEAGLVVPVADERAMLESRSTLEQVAAALPVPATAELLETDWLEAVQQALQKYRPILLVAGLTTTHGLLDEWLSNRALPLPHQTGYPVLLVPEHLPNEALQPPKRIALSVEDRPFVLGPKAAALAPFLDTLGTDVVTICVLPWEDRAGGWVGAQAAQQCGLTGRMQRSGLHKVVHEEPAVGIQQAINELNSDMLVLLDQGHGWLHKIFSGSIIGEVLPHMHVPVLLLPARTLPYKD